MSICVSAKEAASAYWGRRILATALAIGWTQNIVILENCETTDERAWYSSAVRRFRWSKAELLRKIAEGRNATPRQSAQKALTRHCGRAVLY